MYNDDLNLKYLHEAKGKNKTSYVNQEDKARDFYTLIAMFSEIFCLRMVQPTTVRPLYNEVQSNVYLEVTFGTKKNGHIRQMTY
jgi:hypothetical protein